MAAGSDHPKPSLTRAAPQAAGLPAVEPRADACLEIYTNNPDHTPAEELVTELYVPVAD